MRRRREQFGRQLTPGVPTMRHSYQMSSALRFTVLVAALSLFGCGSGPLRPEGTLCSSDAECGAGLSCVGFGAFSDAGCTTMVKACSTQCTLDADCVALGATYKCFLACDGTRSCGAM